MSPRVVKHSALCQGAQAAITALRQTLGAPRIQVSLNSRHPSWRWGGGTERHGDVGGSRQALPPAIWVTVDRSYPSLGHSVLRGVGVHAGPGGAGVYLRPVRASSELRDGWTRNGTAPCLSFPLLTELKRKVCSLGW